MKKDSTLYVVLFTFVVCAAFVVVLATANQITKERVEENAEYAAESAVLKAFGLADSTTPKEEVERLYESGVTELPGGRKAYKASIDGAYYYAIEQTGSGLWGNITAVVAADAKAERLRGIEILSQIETPGLGGRIDESWFKEQFRGERLGPNGITLSQDGSGKGDPDKENGRADGITGASRTSDFIGRIINAAVVELKKMGGAQ